MNAQAAADYLGYELSYLYQLSSKNVIKKYKPNKGKIFFKKEDLDDWIMRNDI
jgi:excisionase family DNA binding protein